MKQITQKELINLIKDKQENATKMEERLRIQATSKDDLDTAKKCFGEARAYQDLLCYLESVEIVEEQPKQNLSKMYGKLPISREVARKQFDEFDQPIVEEKIIYAGKVMDYGENIRILDGLNVYQFPKYAVDRSQEVSEGRIVTTIPKAKQEELGITQEELQKMLEKSPITPYNEPKIEPLRNDQFREFEDCLDNKVYLVNAKQVRDICVDTRENKKYFYIDINVGEIITLEYQSKEAQFEAYKELQEWFVYWNK